MMARRLRRILFALLALAAIAGLPSCWDSRELDEQVHVLTGYMDLEEDGMIRLTVEALSLMSAGGATPSTSHTILSARGPSPGEAAWQMIWMSEGEVNWIHTNAMIIGEALARQGLAPIIDSMLEPYDLRRGIRLAVVPGKAADILSGRLTASRHSEQLAGMFTNGELLGALRSDINSFVKQLKTEGVDPATRRFILLPPLPVEHAVEHTQGGGMGGAGSQAGGGGAGAGGGEGGGATEAPPVVTMNGMAIFRDDKLVGFLEQFEAFGLEWLMGPIRGRHIWVPVEPVREGIGLWVYNSAPRTEVEETPDGLVVRCGLTAVADIEEMLTGGDIATPADIAAIEVLAARYIESEIESALAYVTDWGADPLGFGRDLSRHQPDVWDKYRAEWPRGLSEARLEVHCDVTIIGTGMMQHKNVVVPDGVTPR